MRPGGRGPRPSRAADSSAGDVTTRVSRKVCAFVVRDDGSEPKLLTLSFVSDRALPRRLPGGTLLDAEGPLAGLQRELLEETGLRGLVVARKLGIRRYHKKYTGRDIERHDYLLLAPDSVPAAFVHSVTGNGDDAGELFEYRWMGREEISTLDDEFQRDVTLEYLPELFSRTSEVASGVRKGEPEHVIVVDYDPSWPGRFDEQRVLLEEVFGDDAQVEHIGSTAVPGLGSKPILDIMVGVSDLSEAEERIEQLAWLGYEFVPKPKPDVPGRRYFRQCRSGRRAAHLHCVVRGGEEWRRTLAFRDALRRDPAVARDYLDLKWSLAHLHQADRLSYTNAKGSFIEGVLRKLK